MSPGITTMFRLLAAAALLAFALPAAAQSTARVEPVAKALGLPALLVIMHQEGVGYGADLETDLLQGRGGPAWSATVAAIYDTGRMEAMILQRLEAELDDGEIPGILAFFEAEAGQHIIALEIAARRAMLDEDVEAAARDGWMALEAEGGTRWELLTEFAEVNDLVESNVAGAMTANYAFYRGLADGGAFRDEMTEEQILSDVWEQEQVIREETVDWVYSFTSLAYQPLSDEEFRAYVDFAATDAGQALNAALFTAFNDMFAKISGDLGRGAAKFLAGQDI
jgi:ABC-type Fe3+ transport system substrate-binding protein